MAKIKFKNGEECDRQEINHRIGYWGQETLLEGFVDPVWDGSLGKFVHYCKGPFYGLIGVIDECAGDEFREENKEWMDKIVGLKKDLEYYASKEFEKVIISKMDNSVENEKLRNETMIKVAKQIDDIIEGPWSMNYLRDELSLTRVEYKGVSLIWETLDDDFKRKIMEGK
jgi:hypothetical protein